MSKFKYLKKEYRISYSLQKYNWDKYKWGFIMLLCAVFTNLIGKREY